MLKQQQPGSGGGRKASSNGTPSGPRDATTVSSSSAANSGNNNNRTPVGRNRTSVKPPFQSSAAFEGVYNNARMLHFLTAVVGSTCDVRVKNGTVYEGVFKTLSSRCELAVDAVHKRGKEESSPTVPPRREEIIDTMIFSPSDLVIMNCRDVDLNFATRDTFTDTAISSTRVNGEHKEKVLQRWEGGDSNGESYDLENDASNGWDANEMFRYNEVKYGVTSTYDSSLSMYTTQLEKGPSSEGFRQREARAARLASEIESSATYRHRVNLENEEGKSEEDKYSAVVREGNDRERGRESPRDRDRERGRDSPGAGNREGKYIPLPQRQREMNRERERAERGPGGGPGGPPPHNRLSSGGGGGYRSNPQSSSRPPLPSGTGTQPAASPSERSSPLSGRGGAYASSPGPAPGAASPYTPASPGGPVSATSASAAPSPASPPHGHSVPHSHSLPHSLSEAGRPVNGVSSRTSPKAQRPPQSSRTIRTPNAHSQATGAHSPVTFTARSPKSGSSQDTPYLDTSSVSMPAQKTSGPAPLFPVDVNEILSTAAKERAAAESPSSTEDGKNNKAPSVQQRSQIEELRKFGKEFRLQPSGGSSSSPSSPAAATPPAPGEASQSNPAKPSPSDLTPTPEPKTQTPAPSPSQASPATAEDASKDRAATPIATMTATTGPISERQSPATPQPARTPVGDESAERPEGMPEQVKKSTLNPNAKEFNPIKPQMTMSKPNTAPTPPRPTPPSPVVLQHPGGQASLYNAPYLSYVSQIHSVQPPQMYQYMSTVNQGKYPRPKGSVVAQRADHGTSAPQMLQATASAAGAPLVASPYPQSYLQYNPQQYGQQQVIQAMSPYPGQPMYSMLQGGARMIGQGGGPHPQALAPPGGPQFQGQGDGQQAQQQGIYGAPQSFTHHSGAVHQPQPSSTPTGNQPPPQHAAPSPGQNAQSGPQPQSLYHSGPLSAPTPPNMPPGHTSPQGSYPIQGYSIHGHQGIPHTYNLGQIAQAHVQGAMSGPHHSGNQTHHQLVMLQPGPPQQGPGSVQQHPQHGPQQGHQQHFYIGHPQAMQVQTHPSPFHPPGN